MARKTQLEQQIEQLDKLRSKGVLTEDEYAVRRSALMSSTAPDVVRVKEGGSGVLGIFKWGFFGCFGMIAAVVVVIVIIAALAAAGSDDESTPAGAAGEVGTNKGDVHVTFAANASGVIAPEGNGDKKSKVTILQSQDNVKSTNQFIAPADGMKWWGVEVEVENVGTKEVTALDWKLRDSNNGEHDEEFVVSAAGQSLEQLYDLTPGGKVRGWIYFEIPEATSPKWLRADPNFLLKNDLYFDMQ